MADRLNGYRILILETREEAQFSRLLAEQGADVLQCPMFSIHDAPDPAPVEAWIRRFIAKPFDDLVLMTGEGLRRLMKVARRIGVETEFVAAVGSCAQIRPRPETRQGAARDRAGAAGHDGEADLRRDRRDAVARRPQGHRVGLQLYPDKDHGALIGAIKAQGAEVDTVLPYVYDAQAADANIVTAIDEMANGHIDAIALTSSGQVRRLIEVAQAHGCEARLARRAEANADCVGGACGVGRTEIPGLAHRHLSRQRRLLHEAADLGDGDSARQDRAAQCGQSVMAA